MDGPVVAADQSSGASIDDAIWTGGPVTLPRGRSVRDPKAHTVTFQCVSREELETSLRSFLDNSSASPEHATCELTVWAGASFIVPPPRYAQGQPSSSQSHVAPTAPPSLPVDATSISIMQALMPMPDDKQTLKRQRVIAKAIVDVIQRVDGFRYSFHNNWKSGEEGAHRFSYYCNDSLLNKDRVANGKAGTAGKLNAVASIGCMFSSMQANVPLSPSMTAVALLLSNSPRQGSALT